MIIETEDLKCAQISIIGGLGSIRIPVEIRKELGLSPGDKLQWLILKDKSIHITITRKKDISKEGRS